MNACKHVTDPFLVAWHRRNPQRLCARCFLGGEPLPRRTEKTHEQITAEDMTPDYATKTDKQKTQPTTHERGS